MVTRILGRKIASQGCPSCDEHPDFPMTHCGKPACRDAHLIAMGEAHGLAPSQALEAASTGRLLQENTEAGEMCSTSLCGSCVLVEACVVGAAVARTAQSLGAVVSECAGHKARKT